jgi:hypothetical protein
MAIIYSYPTGVATGTDKVLGIDASDASKTVVFTIDSIVGAGSAGVFSTATLTGALSVKGGTSYLKTIEISNLPSDSSPTYGSYRPSTYITYPARTAAVYGSVGIGSWALQNESTASDWWTTGSNVAVGVGSGREVTTGIGNVYTGFESGNKATTGNFNAGFGNGALVDLTTGGNNVAAGALSGGHLTTANSTISLGHAAGYENNDGSDRTTGSNCIIVGAFAKGSANGTANEIVLGYSAVGAGSNTVRLGNTAVTSVTTSGDVETDTVGKGFILKSPNGTRYRISVSNAGALSASAV